MRPVHFCRPVLRRRDRLHCMVHRGVSRPTGLLSFEAVVLPRLQEHGGLHSRGTVLREHAAGQRPGEDRN